MIVKLYDKREFQVNAEQAQKVIKAIERNTTMIKIGDSFIKTAAIESVTPGGFTEADIIKKPEQISAPVATVDSPGYKKFLAARKELRL